MSIIQGVRGAGVGNSANQKVDVWKSLMVLKPYNTPLTQYAFMGGKPAKAVANPRGKFSWFEDEFLPHQTATSDGITASGATLTLTTSNVGAINFFNSDDLVLTEETEEMFYVSSVSSTQVVLTTVNGGNATNLTSGHNVKILASVRSEDATQRTAYDTQETEVYNYLTIMDATVSQTNREIAGENYTDGLSFAEKIAKKQEEMKLQFERLAFLSKSAGTISQSSNMIKSYGKGALGFITTNVSDYGSALSESAFDSFLQDVGAKGSMRRDLYCGSDLYYPIQSLIKAKIGSLPQVTKGAYGVDITKYHYGGLTINLIYDPVLDGKFSYYGFALDPDTVVGRYMKNDRKGSRKFRIELNTQTPGADYESAKLIMDLGIQIMNESKHGILYT